MTDQRAHPPAEDSERSPWAQPGFIAAAAILGFIVVLGAVLAVIGEPERTDTTPSPPVRQGPSTAEYPARAGGRSASSCGLPTGSGALPRKAIDGSWELVGRVAAPTAPRTVGPGRVDGGLRSCFARSAEGALFAAANVIAMTASTQLRARFVEELVVDGIGRRRARALLARTPATSPDDPSTLQVAGFRVLDYSSASALVDLALRVTTDVATGLLHVELALRWEAGDWKLAVADTGDVFGGMARISALTGYTPWSA